MGRSPQSSDGGLIRVWLVGAPPSLDPTTIRWANARPLEASDFEITTSETDADVWRRLAAIRPHVIVSFGEVEEHRALGATPLHVRRRWIHADDESPHNLAQRILDTFVVNATTDRFDDHPLVSVITPTYRTGPRIHDTYRSLVHQRYDNWEWVVYDDSDDRAATVAVLRDLAATDPRVRVYRGIEHDGSIGSVKRRACGLADGSLVVELDHDDQLLPRALEAIVGASQTFPEAGFFYSDGAEEFDDGSPATYPDGWAFGFGGYRREEIGGRLLHVQCYPPVNAKTIRHITAAPNHVRAWRPDAYWGCGGHRPDLMVCDDFDLCVRMFLTTRMVHITECCYLQIHHGGPGQNTQRSRSREIQRLSRPLLARYHHEIHQRFVELGVDDFIWTDDGGLDWSRPGPADGAPANLVYPERSSDQPV